MKDARTRSVALFIDHYNILNGYGKNYDYDVLVEAANKEGQMVFGRVYLLTDRSSKEMLYEFFKRGIEPVYAPQYNTKSLADPMLVCDIMQTLYERPFIETFVIVSGDKDFIPVIRKISEHGKRAIVIGVEGSTAPSLTDECTRLNFECCDYENLYREFKNKQVTIP